eukprot:jgi/Botrbrau1/13416/Bobra.0082s0022.1
MRFQFPRCHGFGQQHARLSRQLHLGVLDGCFPRATWRVIWIPSATSASLFAINSTDQTFRTGLRGRSCTTSPRGRVPTAAVASPAEVSVGAPRGDLPKTFEPGEDEARLYAWWEEQGFFKPANEASGEPFIISMPPPNVTGRLHMGHAMFVTLEDIMTRFQRMRGRPTLWLPGTDHAGIATQMVVEKMLAAEGVTRQSLGRAAFEERVWQWKDQYGGFITQQLRRLGASCDWSRERFTLDAQLSAAVLEAFNQLHEKGLIYRGSYMVNWAPNLQTAVSDLEVEYSEESGMLYYFKYPIAGGTDFLPIATTRPETILGDTAVAVHPEDERYRHLIGLECEVPMSSGRRIPVIGDRYVDREFGTGALKITPGHDVNDYEIGKRAGLPIINIMNDDGTLNASAGRYAGQDRFEARKKLWADLEAAGLALRTEPHTSRIPRSQRGGEIVEPLVREQWFVRMEPLARPALAAVANGEIRILPERFQATYNMWLENIRDWCISRQLWWGHRIPVWYVFPDEAAAEASADGRSQEYVVAHSQEEAVTKARQLHGEAVALRQETDVLDTWFSSGLWPFSTLGWPDPQAPDLQCFYPTSVMETGHDILFFWVARMIMLGLEFTGKPPFHTVFLHGLVRDGQGRKMSKSLGNVVDPVEVVDQYGTDALRFTLATGTTPGQDLNLSMERIVANRNFTNKLWNTAKFVLLQLQSVSSEEWERLADADLSSQEAFRSLSVPDRWILSTLHQTVDRVTAALERLDFGEMGRLVYAFVWSQFADWYIESAKARLYGSTPEAAAHTREVLVYVLTRTLALAHPVMPFITERIWQALPHRGPALMVSPWPATSCAVDPQALTHYEALQAVVTAVRNARAEYGVELGRKIPASLRIQSDDLRQALYQEAAVLSSLAKIDPEQMAFCSTQGEVSNGAPAEGVAAVVVQEGLQVDLPLAGLFDVEKEVARLLKQREKVEKDMAGVAARMANKKFLDKAPPNVVAEVQAQHAEAVQKLAALDEKLSQMRQLTAT